MHLICFKTVLTFHFSKFLCNFIREWNKTSFTHSFICLSIQDTRKLFPWFLHAIPYFYYSCWKVRPSSMVTKFVFFRRFYNFFYNVRFLLIRRNSPLPIWIDLSYQVHISRCCETFIANFSKTVLRKLPKCC